MKSNLSPRYIAAVSSLVAAIVSVGFIAYFTHDVMASLITFLAVFSLCFAFSFYLLQNFVYRRIKVIYKSIYRFKTTGSKLDDLFKKGKEDPLETVSREVADWMQENRTEIQQLKQQENFRRDFIGNVSHELKTPLQSVQGYLYTLLDGALEDEKVNRSFLKKASNNVERLVDLVSELTSISELEADDSQLLLENFDIKNLALEVFEMVEKKALDREVNLTIKKDSIKKAMVHADKNRIRQVLINLIINAIKYGKKGGHVRVGFYDMDKNVLIEVADNGVGIAEEHLPRLFERFYRTDKGRSRDQGGSGLGLSIVKHIIEAHNQTITVRSTLGEGATFGFTLQAAPN